jgi:C1A family cysteine protease
MEYTTLSPLFLYYQARVLEDTVNIDSGAEMRDGMRVLVNLGICSEVHHPYDITKFTEKPSLDDYVNAAGYKITSYSRVLGLAGIKSCLATGRGLALGFYVYESFESSDVATTGKMPMPRPGEVMLGGHAVFCCGYKDDPAWAGGGYLIIKNSWGSTWGDMGYFYMPYEYASNYSNVPDAWTATV